MGLLRFLSTVICVLIAAGAVSGEDVMKAVGDSVSFRPDKFIPPVTSIIWKQINTAGNVTVKVIEWDETEPEIQIPNQRFKGITAVDEKTGEITINNLKVEHSGVYTIDINSKEQQQRFPLTVMERVPKPVIKIEKTTNPDVVYLRCEYSEKIIWKDSAGKTKKGSTVSPKGESITVEKNENPENFYTCTLDNGASQETSDPVLVKDLFEDGSKSGSGLIVGIIIIVIIIVFIVVVLFFLYKRKKTFKERVDKCFPCLGDKGMKGNDAKHDAESMALNKENEEKTTENNDVQVGEPKTPEETPNANDNGVTGNDAKPENMALDTENVEKPTENNDEMNTSAPVEVQSLEEKL